MNNPLTEAPNAACRTFLDFPLVQDLENIDADFAVLGVPFGMPYYAHAMANDQCRAPDAIRQAADDPSYTREHHDFDLDGPLLNGENIRVVDCGNVTADRYDHEEHYRRAETAARLIFERGTTLITLGGDHGIPIPIMRALDTLEETVTLVHIDAHLDWRHEINGETNGYSSPIRRASEMPWIGRIVQIGLRGCGSARGEEVADAKAYGAEIIDAYELHAAGIAAVIDRIPDGGPYYLTIDADGLDPTIMPAVIAPTPGGLDWFQTRAIIHGLAQKGRIVGMDLVEITPSRDIGNLTLIHAERIICNFIGAMVRSPHRRPRQT